MGYRPSLRWRLLASVLALFVLHDSHSRANSQPYDSLLEALAKKVVNAAQAPEAELALLDLWHHWEDASPGKAHALLLQLAKEPKLGPTLQARVEWLLAHSKERMGESGALGAARDSLGFVRQVQVLGPFDNEGKAGFDRPFPLEAEAGKTPDFTRVWEGKERPLRWRPYGGRARDGLLDLGGLLRPNENVCAFVAFGLQVDRNQALQLWVGAGGAFKVWWQGREVLKEPYYRRAFPDRDVVKLEATRGEHRLLAKVCTAEGQGSWGLYMRVRGADGKSAKGIRFIDAPASAAAEGAKAALAPGSTKEGAVAEAASSKASKEEASVKKSRLRQSAKKKAARPTQGLRSNFRILEAAAQQAEAKAEAHEAFARYLEYTGADDPAEEFTKQHALRAVEKAPTIARLRIAVRSVTQRSEALVLGQKAAELAPQDLESILLRAQIARGGPSPDEALRLLAQLPASGTPSLQGARLRAEIYSSLELRQSALRILEGIRPLQEGTPAWYRMHGLLAEQAGNKDRSIEDFEALLKVRHDDRATRRKLIDDALRRGDEARALAHLDVLRRSAGDQVREWLYFAQVYQALNRDEDALALLAEARGLAPEAPELAVAQGKLLLRRERDAEAALALQEALKLRPQDSETRELLEQLRPQKRRDEAYAVPAARILQRRVARSEHSSTVLQDLVVNTVFANGLGTSFRQFAVQVHDEDATRQWRTYSIQFNPGAQRIDIRSAKVYRKNGRVLEATRSFEQQLSEPWYRVYYDTRARVLVFPDLEAGDVVEVRYRVDDVAHRNLFADYYGDFHVLQNSSPIRQLDYVLITPTTRHFYVNKPQLRGLRHTQQVRGGDRVDHWSARDIPALQQEERMPGLSEVAPYLHISTYKSWEDVGRWYWGLIRDQLFADDALKRKVAELVRGAKDDRDKVRRIFEWVIRNTRYVALEFGIHGYRPYRVTQIVERGFGDCKDKASLLYTMLRQAGIDARIALIRTRPNGAIRDLPASLAVFDHAIAYVPQFDLFLDGTAEYSGSAELPGGDQGAVTLLVGPNDATFRKTPVDSPERNRDLRQLTLALKLDGSAQLSAQGEIQGAEAASYRSLLQAQGTRQERFQNALRAWMPGLRLESQSFESLDDPEAPVRYRYQAQVPSFAQRNGKQLLIRVSELEEMPRRFAARPERRYPLEVGVPRTYREELEIRLPKEGRIVELPTGGEAKSAFGSMQLQIEKLGADRLRLRNEMVWRTDKVAAKDYPAFRRWIQAVDTLLRQRIVFELAAKGKSQ